MKCWAIRLRVRNGILPFVAGSGRRHGWDVTREMLTFVPGIVRGQAFALQCFTNPGDRVMVMTPVYHPFFLVTQRMKREVVYSPLDLKDGQYQIDLSVSVRIYKDAKY